MNPAKVAFLFGTVPDGFDPENPDHRAELLRGAGDLPPASLAVREIVATQVADETPPEAWATVQRLLAEGMEPATVMSQMVMAMAHTLQAALAKTDGATDAFDLDGYCALLRRLPLPDVAEIERATVALVRANPEILIDELVGRVVEALGEGPHGLVAMLVDRVFDQLVDDDGPLALLAGDRVVHVGDLTQGIVLTHRLTARERASHALAVSFDLSGFVRRDETHLAPGADLEWEWISDDDIAWVGPDGWLAAFEIGSLLAVRVGADGLVTIEQLQADPDPDADAVALLRSVYDRETEEAPTPITGEELVIGMLVADRRIFDRPLPPLEQLCEPAGLERRGTASLTMRACGGCGKRCAVRAGSTTPSTTRMTATLSCEPSNSPTNPSHPSTGCGGSSSTSAIRVLPLWCSIGCTTTTSPTPRLSPGDS